MTVYVFASQMAGYRDIRLIWKLRASIFGVVPGRTTRLVRQTGLDGDAIVHTAARDDAASNECALATPGPSGPFLWAIAQYGVRTKKRLLWQTNNGFGCGTSSGTKLVRGAYQAVGAPLEDKRRACSSRRPAVTPLWRVFGLQRQRGRSGVRRHETTQRSSGCQEGHARICRLPLQFPPVAESGRDKPSQAACSVGSTTLVGGICGKYIPDYCSTRRSHPPDPIQDP